MFEVYKSSLQMLRYNQMSVSKCYVDPVMSGGFFFILTPLKPPVQMCVSLREWSREREREENNKRGKRTAKEIKGKEKRRGQPLRSAADPDRPRSHCGPSTMWEKSREEETESSSGPQGNSEKLVFTEVPASLGIHFMHLMN